MPMIFGAGMAGLLAGCVFRGGTIFETQPSLPNNHHALLRFRSSVVGDYLGVEFRPVDVIKASVPWRNPVADALSYSYKANGRYSIRSSATADGSVFSPLHCSQRFHSTDGPISSMVRYDILSRLTASRRWPRRTSYRWAVGHQSSLQSQCPCS